MARLKLKPRFESDEERGLVRIDAAPLYDAPPTVDDLYRAAAKNHELETAYYAERVAQRTRRSDDDRARRETVAEAFLADKGQRAVAHPPPSPRYASPDRGRLLFDITTDQGIAKRFRRKHTGAFALTSGPKENAIGRTEPSSSRSTKKQFIADWVAANGTDEQKTRQAAGVLPMAEAIEGITDQAFAVNGRLPLYTRDGADRYRGSFASQRGRTTSS